MGGRRVVVLYSQLLAEVFKCVFVELFSIVRDENPRNFESADMLFQTELHTFFSVMVTTGFASTDLVK